MTAIERISNRSITILGMARSGLAAAELAQACGAHVFVSDSADTTALTDALSQLEVLGIDYETGGHTDRALEADYVIISPGIPSHTPIVSALRNNGTPVFSELEFASWLLRGKMIAVTGSNGKTTTAHMIHSILLAERWQSILCGNVGVPLSAVVRKIEPPGVAVVEVSSYQLEFVDQFRPNVAVITNLTPDHLERHGSLAQYRDAKLRITDSQSGVDSLCLNIDSPELDALAVSTAAHRKFFGADETLAAANAPIEAVAASQQGGAIYINDNGENVKLIAINELKVPGQHNVENALAAASATHAMGVGLDAIRHGLREFGGVEHRIERVAEFGGVTFVNDSKATNLDATAKALAAITTPVRLILGGRSKGEDFRTLMPYLKGSVTSVIAIGEAREEIFEQLGKQIAVQFAEDMAGAVSKLFADCTPGETALLSPGCASFDMYNDFEERGRDFKRQVMKQIERAQENVVKN